VKLFKRSAKDTAEASSPAQLPSTGKKQRAVADLKALLPGAIAASVGLLAAAVMLWYALFYTAQTQQQAELSRAWGDSQAAALQQAVKQLSADTAAAARNPQLIFALQSGKDEISAAERSLGYWEGVVDAQLNARGQAVQDGNRAAPMNFAALDMLRRAEGGQIPAPEAYKIGQRWLVYSAAPLRLNADSPPEGTLLLVVDLQRLLSALPTLEAGIGQLQLSQQFGKAPAQLLEQRGQAAEVSAQSLNSGNPNWKLSFTPGTALTQSIFPIELLLVAALLAFAGALLGLYLTHTELQHRLRADVGQLTQLVNELAAGKSVKAFSLSLPLLDALAKLLARMSQRKREHQNTPESSPAARPEPAPAMLVDSDEALSDPLFQDTDILDIDILDEDLDLLGLEQNTAMIQPNSTPPTLDSNIFRAYDIRGVVGAGLTPQAAYWIGRAIGSASLAQGEPHVSVGRDGRLSGPMLVEQLIQGLLDCGCQVSDVGMVPTPVLYYAANILAGKSGVMLTGSHNPPDYNGFKIVIAGDTLANEQIQDLRRRIETNDLASGVGNCEQIDVLQRYFNQIRDDIAMAKPMRVVVDCGNGVAGVIAPQLIEALGCTVIPLFCDVDGNFPNHHPDPGKPENLVDLIAKVKSENADLGLAFDGDGDRVGVVTNTGTIVYPDRLLMLFAKDVVSRNPGADIIFDVKCTRRLTPLISGYGGRPVMWKTGHSLIKKKMKETGALLAGEMSGHIFFKERWFGFDDGIYAAARLLEILSQDKRAAEHVFSAFPNDICTPEINIEVTDESKFSIIEALQRNAQWGEANITSLDGVRADYPKGWGLVRASNTTPVLVLRFEAETIEELKRIQEVFRSQIASVAPQVKLPF
jgi:phosphomannomutase/phosphoglucomutase